MMDYGFMLHGMFPIWTVVVGFYIGATVGSFMNMIVWRLPRGISFWNPRHSICPNCRTVLGFSELIPLFSWLVQRGQCKTCGEPIKARYFWVEVITGLVWAGLWWQTLIMREDVVPFFFYAAGLSTLLVAFFIDWELFIIPEQVNSTLLFIGFGYNVYLWFIKDPHAMTGKLPSSVAGALTGFAVLWGITFLGRVAFGKDAMGHGDIKLARGIGALLFPALSLWSFAMAVVMGAVLGIIQIRSTERKATAFEGEQGDKVKVSAVQAEEAGVAEEDIEPESLSSILWCGLGYLLLIDVIGLFVPRLYIWWFKEDPFAPISEMDDFQVENTMIPFGPYLALGAIIAVLFQDQLTGAWHSYMKYMQPSPPSQVEHLPTLVRSYTRGGMRD